MNRSTILIAVLLTVAPALCPAAQLLVLNKGDATLSFIDPATGETSAKVATGTGPHEIEVSDDGRLAFVSNYGIENDGNTLSVIDVQARKELRRVDLGELRRPHGLSFLKDRLYLTAERNQLIARYDPASQNIDWKFPTSQDGTHMVVASRDGRKLFASNMGSNTVGILDLSADGQARQTLVSVGAGPEGLDESPNGRELWTAHSRDGRISIIDIESRKVLKTFDAATKRSNRLKFTPDGKRVLVSDLAAHELVVIDALSHSTLARLPIGKSPTGILMNPDGKRAYVAITAEKHLAVVDLATLASVGKIATGSSPDGMAWVP